MPNQTEPNLEEVRDSLCSLQYKYEKAEAKENEVLGQSCQQEIAEEVFRAQSAEEENHLKVTCLWRSCVCSNERQWLNL